MTDEIDYIPPQPGEHPQARTWLWVLTFPITDFRDSMLVLNVGEGDFIPVFATHEHADGFLEKLGEVDKPYIVQAMHLIDVQKFAKESNLPLVFLDSQGKTLPESVSSQM
ncbi:MAG: hypothetical protein LBV23_02505 [Deltaproteobacteria bacterium]|jgi:hypothetical protein|nr:hypothetical protein [Deltaproteobacteria bacterium]